MTRIVMLLEWVLAFDWADDAAEAVATRDSLWIDDEPVTEEEPADHALGSAGELAS